MSRDEALKEVKQFCVDIGCGGISKSLCEENPQDCNIVRKAFMPTNKEMLKEVE